MKNFTQKEKKQKKPYQSPKIENKKIKITLSIPEPPFVDKIYLAEE